MSDPSPAAPAARPSPWRWWVCVLLLLASTLNYMDRMALNQTAVRIKLAFGIDNTWYGALESVFTIGFAVGTLFTGWLVDRVNVRWVYPAAVVGWSAFGFLTGFAPGYWILFACRFGLGVFEAGNWPCGVRTTRQVMPPAERALGNSFFQNGTAIGAIVTPAIVLACLDWVGPDEPDAWQVPFRVIGVVGLVWVALWVFTVPGHALRPVVEEDGSKVSTPFSAVFADVRFWLLIAVVIGVNTSWHTFRVWLPLFLQKQHGYSEREMSWLSTYYYLAADLGVWVVGLGSVWLAKKGMSFHRGRMLLFAMCTALGLTALSLPFLKAGPVLVAVLLVYGFGAYGLFPIYFTLSQELSAKHQGKVTGTLGCINALYLAAVQPAFGAVTDATGRYDPFMAVAGLPALVALLLVAYFWRTPVAETKSP
jgi:ACS family hexuronate transporter-like MFS transporter